MGAVNLFRSGSVSDNYDAMQDDIHSPVLVVCERRECGTDEKIDECVYKHGVRQSDGCLNPELS